ncbi:MAG TPA: hypothetical protein VK849_15905 [Longimicrobiales bacterium]|nr:hypothetical protein [Longimicrobiales bacterium]
MSAVVRRISRSVLACAAAFVVPAAASGQDVQDLASSCVASGGAAMRCTELAVTARALQGHLGLMAGLGSEVSGSASTLGRRLGATPRISFGARAAFASVELPDVTDQGGEPSRENGFVLPSVQLGAAAGLFDGFSLAPTVGGFLSLDVVGHASFLFLPTGEGFDGGTTAFSVGARVGILRESFTLPGVSVSVTRRGMGGVRYGDAPGEGGGSVAVDPSVTSLRATVGKDLLSVGVLAGFGWERYGGEASIQAELDGGLAEASSSSFEGSRTLWFGGASMNFLILQLSGELGWATGFDRVPEYLGAPFDPTSGTLYGSLAFRLTL